MKFLFVLLLLGSCAEWSNSRYKCDKKVGSEKEACEKDYQRMLDRLDYQEFRGSGLHNEDL
jgi:hypothetical protein